MDPEQVRSVRMPTFLLNGRHSPGLFHRLTEALAELLPRAQRIEIADASHIMQEDNPAVFNKAVLAFLQRQSA